MPLLKPSEFLASVGHGHCGETADLGDCTIGEKGSFKLTLTIFGKTETPQRVRRLLLWCLDACESCSSCNYISFSFHFRDCASAACLRAAGSPAATQCSRPRPSLAGSWYRACDLQQLERPPDGNWSHFLSAAAFSPLPRTPAIPRKWPRANSRERRAALRLPAAEAGEALAWVQPHRAMRVALVLYGKVGTFRLMSSGTTLRGVVEGPDGAQALLTQAHRTWQATPDLPPPDLPPPDLPPPCPPHGAPPPPS